MPAVLVIPSVVALALLLLPVVGLVVRAPWSRLGSLDDPVVVDALRLSAITSTASTVVVVVLGLPLAWVLARVEFRGKKLVRAFVTVPLILPPVVGGVALLTAFGVRGIVGQPLLDVLGVRITFTTAAVVLAQTFVSLPFLVISVEGALRTADRRFDEVAASLGASRWRTFRRVTVPLAAPGLAGGAALAWARALGEFGATITFAGNFQGTTRTTTLEIYGRLQSSDPDVAILLSLVLLGISVLILVLLRERWVAGGLR
ncbi:ABC transporter permease [Solicola sp. PLA-1-18]|uniref:ABC transporter permease n=1 Tax=Solicola sp. PLA-1-18 TaxID=3380532 RepID=UPI003B7F3252